jgi:hypothetical protein
VAISLIVRTEHGKISIPIVGNEPDEIAAPILLIVLRRQGSKRGGLQIGLIGQCHLGRFAHDQVSFDVRVLQELERAHAVDDPGSARDSDNEPARMMSFSRFDPGVFRRPHW